MSWNDTTFESLVDFYDYMRVPLSSMERDTMQGGFRYYGAQGVIDHINGYIFDGEYILIAEDGANLVTRNQPIALIAKGQFWVNNHAHIVQAKPDQSTNYFVKALLNNLNVAGYITGVAQPKLSQKNLKQIKITVPDFETQERISDVLSAYDDLIENNRRRIALLEEAARLLYREWFVHFRFPGAEHVKIVDGVPEGWEKKTVGDVATTNPESYKKGNLPETLKYIDISSVTQGRVNQKTELIQEEAPGRARRIARHGDIIWSNVRPNLRAYAIVLNPDVEDVFSTGFTIIRAQEVPFYYLYFTVTTDAFVGHLVNHATGVSYPAVRPDDFERAEILIPAKTILSEFHEFCVPLFRQIETLNLESIEATKARDLLLPRLMDGRLEI